MSYLVRWDGTGREARSVTLRAGTADEAAAGVRRLVGDCQGAYEAFLGDELSELIGSVWEEEVFECLSGKLTVRRLAQEGSTPC